MDIFDAIKARTSYRGAYEKAVIPRDDLKAIVEAGLCAPSGCNKQTTSMIVIDDADLLAKLYAVINPHIEEATTAVICVLTKKTVAYRNKTFYIQDYSAAIENMLLAVIGLGYQSCWYEGHITDEDALGRKMADILDVPQGYELVCFLPIGIASDPIATQRKKAFEQRVWFNGFGRKD